MLASLLWIFVLGLKAGDSLRRAHQGSRAYAGDDIAEHEDDRESEVLRGGARQLWGMLVADRQELSSSSSPPKASDHLVKNLPGLKEDLTSYAGLLPGDAKSGGKIFYWMVECSHNPEKAPLMIWLNGGPGCSSMDGLFLELGPFRIKGDSLDINPYSWHNVANIVFVDQPVGTGFSFTQSKSGYAKSDTMVNEHFYTFLQNFLKVHDKFMVNTQKTRPIYFAGESHAGHYIPNMISHILAKNGETSMKIDVQGAALGDPWMDPKNQYDATELAHSLSIISHGQMNYLIDQRAKCQKQLRDGRLSSTTCYRLLDDIIEASTTQGKPKVLMYDARKYVHSTNEFPPGKREVERYMNKAEVKRAIHVDESPQRFVECADPPFDALSHQDGKGAMGELATALNTGIRVLVYSGQYDLICNHVGTETALRELKWDGQEQWKQARPGAWFAIANTNGQPAGYVRTYRNLQSVVVKDAGHMVPMDQPAIALEMIKKFVDGKDLSSQHSKIPVMEGPPALACEENGEVVKPRSLDVPPLLRETDLLAGISDGASLLALGSSPFAIAVLICFGITFLVLFWRASRARNGSTKFKKEANNV